MDTSLNAYESIKADKEAVKAKILEIIRRAGGAGITCDEAEDITGWKHQTVSARFRDLVKERRIHYREMTRKTRSGRPARVYFFGPEETRQLDLFNVA